MILCGIFEWKCICLYRLFISVLLLEIQLSRGEGWDPVIRRGVLRSSYQEGGGCDPVIKRGVLGSSYQEGSVEIQLSRGEC